MTIQRMIADHVAQVAALELLCFSDPWSEKSIALELSNPLSLWLVAANGGQVAGYIGSQSVLGEADMMNLAVSPAYRKQGIAKALVLALIEQLKYAGVHCLTLEVRASNLPALNLYNKLGFSKIGRRPQYYEKPREDALILRKEWDI